MRFFYCALILVILSSTALVLADERSSEPNWCFEGQAWGDGRCNDPDPYINDYNWRMGWLMAHCELGLLPAEICSHPDSSAIFGGDGKAETNFYALYTLGGGSNSGSLYFDGSISTGGGIDTNGNIEPPSFYLADINP